MGLLLRSLWKLQLRQMLLPDEGLDFGTALGVLLQVFKNTLIKSIKSKGIFCDF